MRLLVGLLALAAPLVASAAPALVWSDQGADDSVAIFYRAAPGQPREKLGAQRVSPGYEPRSSVCPDGSAVISTVLADGQDRAQGATLVRLSLAPAARCSSSTTASRCCRRSP